MCRRVVGPVLAALVLFASPLVAAAEPPRPAGIAAEKQTKAGKYLTARAAYDLVRQERGRVVFLDIRTRAELATVGMTSEVDGHVPYVEFSEFWDWDDGAGRFKLDPNQNFAQAVAAHVQRKGLGKTDRVILMCRSGDRSARAANLLTDLGYTNVYSVVDGFEGDLTPEGRREVNGWKNSLLPWSYKLDKSKIYLAR